MLRFLGMLALAALAGAAAANAPDNKGAPLGTKPVPLPKPTGPLVLNNKIVIQPLTLRIIELVDVLNGKPGYDSYFAPSFKASVSKAAFDTARAKIIATTGTAVSIATFTQTGPSSADLVMVGEKSEKAFRIAIDAAKPHQVTLLQGIDFTTMKATPKDVVKAIGALPGQTNFGFFRLGDGKPVLLDGSKPSVQLAIGSAFKLVVLAELARSIKASERSWVKEITIGGAQLPPGFYSNFSTTTPISLTPLATKMIQNSDNSATDLMMRELGRDKVEAMLPVLGVVPSALNRPWLTTLEAFKLKSDAVLAKQYLSLNNDDAQRTMLDGQVAKLVYTSVPGKFPNIATPVLIDQIEWFESLTDIARVYDWLRLNNDFDNPADPVRKILNSNGALTPDVAAQWQYVGYKGGSEAGVITYTYMLHGKDGQWYVLAASWNNSAQAVDNAALSGLMAKYASLLAP